MSTTDNFNDVFDRDSGADTAPPAAEPATPRDEAGRFAPKSEPQQEAQQSAPTEQGQAAPETPQDPSGRGHHVPLSELLTEREKRKGEAKLREESEKRASEYEARAKTLEQLLQQSRQPAPQQAQQPPQQIPDPFADPEGYARYQDRKAFIDRRNDIANMSEAFAVRAHGRDVVSKAIEAAHKAGVADHFFMRANDPYGELLDWHKQQAAFQRIGPDPDAYEKKLEQSLREKILAELKQGGAKPQPKFPGSLADATAGGSQGAHLTEEAIANELFSTTRNRRA